MDSIEKLAHTAVDSFSHKLAAFSRLTLGVTVRAKFKQKWDLKGYFLNFYGFQALISPL